MKDLLKKVPQRILRPQNNNSRGRVIIAISVLVTFFLNSQATAQDLVAVKGRITNETGQPVSGASVIVKGSTIGTTADDNGNYKITAPANGTLVISAINFSKQEVKINRKETIDVSMIASDKKEEEVVVVGYGKQSRAKITSSIVTLDKKVLENSSFANIGSALQGTITGVRVATTSGQPGKVPAITLRGGAVISDNLADFTRAANSPLVVVDGVIRDLDDIDANTIESMTVLKDAAATAIYGARGNNGVILIVSKSGKPGPGHITYRVNAGLSFVRDGYDDRVDAENYVRYSLIAQNNSFLLNQGMPQNPANIVYFKNPGNSLYGVGRNTRQFVAADLASGWQYMAHPIFAGDSLIFYDRREQIKGAGFVNPGATQEHSIAFSGGNEKGVFYASLGYFQQDGSAVGTKYKRFTGTLSGSYKIRDNLQVSGMMNISQGSVPPLYIDDASFFLRTTRMVPTWEPYLANGTPNPGTATTDGNPEYYLERFVRKNSTRRSTYTIGAKWNIIKELTFSADASLYRVDATDESFDRSFQLVGITTPNTTRTAIAQYNYTNRLQTSVKLDYTKSFGNHNISTLIGAESFTNKLFSLRGEGNRAPSDDIYTLNASAIPVRVFSSTDEYRILSGFGRFSYDYKNKYLFTFVGRYDGTSVLSKENRWGFFPGVSAGWNLHMEDFYQNSGLHNIVSEFKPRISYGVNGNVAGITSFEAQGGFAPNIRTYSQQQGISNSGIVNGGLRWEKTKAIEAGLDMGLLKNKINITAGVFNRKTEDIIVNFPLPTYTGYTSLRTNLGILQNRGYEFSVNASILKMKNGLTWDIGFNASHVENKILKLPNNGLENNRQGGQLVYDPKTGNNIWVGGYQEGQAFGDVYAWTPVRILTDMADVIKNANNLVDVIAGTYGPAAYAALTPVQRANRAVFKPLEPGDVLWEDRDGNGIINNLDQRYVGNIFPKWTGGFSTTVGYKGFSLYLRGDFTTGHIIYNYIRSLDLGVGSFSYPKDVAKMWTPENPNAVLPKLYGNDPADKMNIIRKKGVSPTIIDNSAQMLELGNYLAFREATLSYKIPQSLISKIKLSALSANITVQNLSYITNYTGLNPEYGGVDTGRYPVPILLQFGLRASF